MELLNVGRRGKDRYQTLQHGLQHTRPKACLTLVEAVHYLRSLCSTAKDAVVQYSCHASHVAVFS